MGSILSECGSIVGCLDSVHRCHQAAAAGETLKHREPNKLFCGDYLLVGLCLYEFNSAMSYYLILDSSKIFDNSLEARSEYFIVQAVKILSAETKSHVVQSRCIFLLVDSPETLVQSIGKTDYRVHNIRQLDTIRQITPRPGPENCPERERERERERRGEESGKREGGCGFLLRCGYTHTHRDIQTHTHTQIHTQTQIHTHTHTHKQIHTQTHKHTHTHTMRDASRILRGQSREPYARVSRLPTARRPCLHRILLLHDGVQQMLMHRTSDPGWPSRRLF